MPDSLAIGPYTVGEKPVPLEYQFLSSLGAPLDLTGYTALFHYRRSDEPQAITVSAAVTDPTAGKVTHVWSGDELSTPGTWWLEFWVGNGTQRYASKRLDAAVWAPVGPVPTI